MAWELFFKKIRLFLTVRFFPLSLALFIVVGILASGSFIIFQHKRILYNGGVDLKKICALDSKTLTLLKDFFCPFEKRQQVQGALENIGAEHLIVKDLGKGRVWFKFSASSSQTVLKRTSSAFFYYLKGTRDFFFRLFRAPEAAAPKADEIAFSFVSKNFSEQFLKWRPRLPSVDHFFSTLKAQYRFPFVNFLPYLKKTQFIMYTNGDMAVIVRNKSQEDLQTLAKLFEQAAAHVFSTLFPEEKTRILPDRTKTVELLFNPSRFSFTPQTKENLTFRELINPLSELSLSYYLGKDYAIFSTSSERLKKALKQPRANFVWETWPRACKGLVTPFPNDFFFVSLPRNKDICLLKDVKQDNNRAKGFLTLFSSGFNGDDSLEGCFIGETQQKNPW